MSARNPLGRSKGGWTGGEAKPPKYRNTRTPCPNGHTHSSKKEAKRCYELHILQRAGKITHLRVEPKYELMVDGEPILMRSAGYPNGRRASFKPDFDYFDVDLAKKIVEDTKSPASRTEAYQLRKAVFEACYPGLRVLES